MRSTQIVLQRLFDNRLLGLKAMLQQQHLDRLGSSLLMLHSSYIAAEVKPDSDLTRILRLHSSQAKLPAALIAQW